MDTDQGAFQKIIAGVERFQTVVYPQKEALFRQWAKTQQPSTLFITCCDSRINPNLITQTEPGELFVIRTIGNIIPPDYAEPQGVAASIEYAVSVLKVPHVVLCGHSECGVIRALMNPSSVQALPQVKSWLNWAKAAAEIEDENLDVQDAPASLAQLAAFTRQNIIVQLERLQTLPAVAARLANNDLQLHGWVYDIENGDVDVYDPAAQAFKPFNNFYARSFVTH